MVILRWREVSRGSATRSEFGDRTFLLRGVANGLGLSICTCIEMFIIESSIATEVDVQALQCIMTSIFVGCVSYTKMRLSPSSERVVEPLDTSLQHRIIILACGIGIISLF